MAVKGFDYTVEHRGKDGRVVRTDPYRMVVDSNGKRLERPPGSGIWYNEDGTLLKDESQKAGNSGPGSKK